MKQRLVIFGSSGSLGRATRDHFQKLGWEVVGVSRSGDAVRWDGRTLGDWAQHVEGATAVLNLAGRSVDCRYSQKHRREILESRLESTRVVGQAIARSQNPPAVWLNASTATIYRHAEDRPQDEANGEIGDGFSVEVAEAWEGELFAAETPRTRKVALRISMVLWPGGGGAFGPFYNLARFGLAGRLAGGRQYVSWMHVEDFCRAVEFLVQKDQISGPVNVTAPDPQPMDAFLGAIRRAVGRGFGLPATRWMLEVGAFVLRTETELLLKSRWVMPGRLMEAGFAFNHPTLKAAIEDLVRRQRAGERI